MSDKKRFQKRRARLSALGLCVRCGDEKAMPGATIGVLCAAEIRTKKIVAPARRLVCEKIARVERKLLFVREAESALLREKEKLLAG